MQDVIQTSGQRGVPHSLGRVTGIAFGATIGYLGFSRAAHAAQDAVFGGASIAVDVAAGAVGGVLGAQMGDALSQQNPQKSFGLFCGLLAAQFAPHVLHAINPIAQPDGGSAALAPPGTEVHHYHHVLLPAL